MRKCLFRVQSRPLSSVNCFKRLPSPATFEPARPTVIYGSHAFFTSSARLQSVTGVGGRKALHQRSLDISASSKNDPSVTTTRKLSPPKELENNPEAWTFVIDQFLPQELRISNNDSANISFQEEANIKDVLKVLTLARYRLNLDILVYMVLDQGRHKAALYVSDLLLRAAASLVEVSEADELPSNIVWPVSFTKSIPRGLEVETWSHTGRDRPTVTGSSVLRACDDNKHDERCMNFILPLLAALTITAPTKPDAEAKEIMRTVHQVIARMHNLNLVPSAIYTFPQPQATTTIQHPPILYLLSSRILSTLSDAVWRAHQDEAIAQAIREGKNYKQISEDVPGGRFRLKVRELGPEVWLEFILWCCVEGGHASAGVRIINALRNRVDDPWYAVHWCSNHHSEGVVPKINWDQVKRRHGGTVGQLEGYSTEEPFAHIPQKTISAEVVLALVDCLFNCTDTGVRGSGLPVGKVQTYVFDVVSFLEPHALGPEYFNYLTVRFLQTGAMYIEAQPDALRSWYAVISQLRLLQTIRPTSSRRVGLDLGMVASQTESQAGLLHQALQAYINRSNATRAVNVFTDIQRHVDSSKLESIDNFLASPWKEKKFSHDFVGSHGQLPTYKMAGFLNMVTDAQLFGLGDWLIDSEDIDGPMIPQTMYQQLCMTMSVAKYADATGDRDLIENIVKSRQLSQSKLSVNVLRALVNAAISVSSWSAASQILTSLRTVPGGGYSPRNVAKLAAKILRIESQLKRLQQDKDLTQALQLLSDILVGWYDGPRADFTTSVKRVFDQQMGYLLRLFENLPASKLQEIGQRWKLKFPVSNQANLAPETFNDVLSAIVEVRGAAEGVRMWNLFCEDPRLEVSFETAPLLGEYVVTEVSSPQSVNEDIFYDLERNDKMPDTFDDPESVSTDNYAEGPDDIPFEEVDVSQSVTDQPFLTPIVIPSIQTLHIIVRGAIAEKERLRGLVKAKEVELNKVLRWSLHFYKVYNYSKSDIEAEIELPIVLKSGGTSNAQLKWLPGSSSHRSSSREINRPDIGRNFNNSAPMTRLPTVART